MIEYVNPELKEIAELSRNIERLRVYYDQYFIGVGKIEPVQLRHTIEQAIRNSNLHEARQTSLRFRFNSLVNRFRVYSVYWDRLLREIEEGRFKREKFRSTLTAVKKEILEEDYEVKKRKVSETSGATPLPDSEQHLLKQPISTIRPAEPAQNLSDLFDTYIRMKKENGEDDSDITFEEFKKSIDRKRAQQMEKLGWDDVSFRVDKRGGRIVLVAKPVKKPEA